MVKRINSLALTIKKLLENDMKPSQIAKTLNISRQLINYWKKTPIVMVNHRSKKLPLKYREKLYKWANNKNTGEMGSRILAEKMNKVLATYSVKCSKTNKQMTISHNAVNNYLYEKFGKPIRIRKAFYLSKDQQKERVKFCQQILDRKLNFDDIVWTDESKIDLSPYLGNSSDKIRLDIDSKIKLKEGDEEVIKLITRPVKKFEQSIMIAGGISYHGLTDLILCSGTMNEFSYAQALFFFKEDIDKLNKKAKKNNF